MLVSTAVILLFATSLLGLAVGLGLMLRSTTMLKFVRQMNHWVSTRQALRPLETPVRPFANLPEPKNARRGEALTAEVMQKCHWLKPELVAQIEYTEWTSANHLRHSRFAGLRDDKDAREVVREPAA